MMMNVHPQPTRTPIKTTKATTVGGVSPVSIFATFNDEQPATPVKKLSPAALATSNISKAKALTHSKLWSTVQEETKGDWSAMHDVLQQQLQGKVQLNWSMPAPQTTVITTPPPTAEEYLQLTTKLTQCLQQRDTLLAQRKAKLLTELEQAKDSVTSMAEEQGGIASMDAIYQSELTRWNLITAKVGNNSLQFPVQNDQCQFDPTRPNLRNTTSATPCTAEEMQQGEWGIEHKKIVSVDVNAIPFHLRRRAPPVDCAATTPIDQALEFQVDPSTELRTFFHRTKVVVSAEESAAGEWGIEHKKLIPVDVNANAFPLVSHALDEKTVLKEKDPMNM